MTTGHRLLSRCPHGVRLRDPKGCDKCYDALVAYDAAMAEAPRPVRVRLAESRTAIQRTFRILHVVREACLETNTPAEVETAEFEATLGLYPDGRPGELFIKWGARNAHLTGLTDALAIALSYSAQHGIPWRPVLLKFVATRFEPSGYTVRPDDGTPSPGPTWDPICHRATSHLDYLSRWLLGYLHDNGIEPRGNQESV